MIYFDEDTDARVFRAEAGTITAGDLQKALDTLKGTRTGVLIVGVTNAKANFPSKVFESYLDGFDASLGMLQPALRREKSAWAYRRCANFQVLFNQGIDSNAFLMDGARNLGISPWIGIRMNDIHNGHNPDSCLHSEFWRSHPELWCAGLDRPCENTLDYSHPQVRKRMLAFIAEVVERYDADAVFLDWMRWPSHVPSGSGPERAPLLTGFMAQAREIIRAAEQQRGHPLRLVCRVPLTPENSLKLGLDAVCWAQQGLIDELVIGQFGCGLESDAPVEIWQQRIGKADFPVSVSIEHGFSRHPGPEKELNLLTSCEDLRGVAAAAYHRGAKAVHLFNFMGCLRREELREQAQVCLNDPFSPETLLGRDRNFRLSWDDSEVRLSDLDQICRIPGYYQRWLAEREKAGLPYPSPLPRKCSPGEEVLFRLYTAWKPEDGARIQLLVETCPAPELCPLQLKINLTGLDIHPAGPGRFLAEVPRNVLRDGWTRVTLIAGNELTVTGVILQVRFS